MQEAANHLTPYVLEAAKGASAIMGMNNVFYRFTHLSSNQKYGTMRAGLRMNVIRTHGIDQLDFELWCIAVSAIDGCGAAWILMRRFCATKDSPRRKILAAVRVACVIHAIAAVLDTERVMARETVTA